MRRIQKGREPRSLVRYKKQVGASFNALDAAVKNDIRRCLLKEQGSICCYCMSRIDERTARIEHWRPRSVYPDKQLEYGNLLAACGGNESGPRAERRCDARKGNRDLTFNPADPALDVEQHVTYLLNGSIRGTSEPFATEIESVLNLNHAQLVINRNEIIQAVQDALGRKGGQRTRRQVEKFIDEWESRDEQGRLKEYVGVALYFLKRHRSMQ